MKNIILTIWFVLFSSLMIYSQYEMNVDYIQTVSENKANGSFTYKHLRIYPLLAGDKFKDMHRDIGKYTNLKDALDKKKITITETTSGNTVNANSANNENVSDNDEQIQINNSNNNINVNVNVNVNQNQVNTSQNNIQVRQNVSGNYGPQVNKLFIQNISDDTIYVMAGEVVKGGKQDRVLGQDMILPPNSEKVDISVFCVEHGRWSGSSGQFDGYFQVSSNSVRSKVIKEKDQSAVWDEVGKTVKKNKTETNSGTYTSLVNSDLYNKEMQAYVEYFKKALASNPNCIGFVGVSGDKIIGCDIFATPDLFQKQSETILKGYITEAIINGEDVKIGYSDVEKYLNELLTKEQVKQNEVIDEKGGQFIHQNKKIHITTF
jgi:hypothetical protein